MKQFLFVLVSLLIFGFSDSFAQSDITYFETIEFAYKEKTCL